MDKYEDFGLEASKFIEDLNMYEASRDGLFRMRRDAGNNPDFEETRRVFATKMSKIHMQKQQEEMAKNNQAIKMNGGAHNNSYYTKDRPPINSYRQPCEAAAKPPMLSGPVPGTAPGGPYAQFDGQKHHAGIQSELPVGRACGYGNNYDNKERSEAHSYLHNTPSPPSPGHASLSAPTHARYPVSQPAAWAPSRESQLSPPLPGCGGSSVSKQQQQPQYQSASSTTNSLPPQHIQAIPPPLNLSPASSAGPAWGWSGEPPGSEKPELTPALPLSAFTAGADFQMQLPSTHSATHYATSSPTSRPSATHNGPLAASSLSPEPFETPLSKAQVASAALIPGNVSKSSSQGQGQSLIPVCGHVFGAEAKILGPSKLVQIPCQSEQGPSAAEMKIEALTHRLEKEMDAQPKTDYFGKTV